MNLISVVIYWTVIHKTLVNDYKGIQLIHLYTVHLLPSIALLINWYLTDVVLAKGHNVGLTIMGIIYMCVNA